jgi:hypothetical protein
MIPVRHETLILYVLSLVPLALVLATIGPRWPLYALNLAPLALVLAIIGPGWRLGGAALEVLVFILLWRLVTRSPPTGGAR